MVDENLSPALAKALNALFVDEHEVIHIRERFGPSVSDPEWIEHMSAEGRWIVISGDRRIAKVKAEQAVFRSSRLIGFFLAPALNAARVTIQMQRLLALWGISRRYRIRSRAARCMSCRSRGRFVSGELEKAPRAFRSAIYKIASMPLRRMTSRSTSAGPLACLAPRSSCET